jgi:hypothetical protein
MALLVFRSRAASEVIMVAENAQRLLEIIGKPMGERGVITAAQIDDALGRLERAVGAEGQGGGEKNAAASGGVDANADATPVGLRQRAFPLMQMLRAAKRSNADVTWGI